MLFHVTWNRPKSETELLAIARKNLVSRLPETWKLIERKELRRSRARADLVLEAKAPDGGKGTILLVAKRTLEPRDIPRLLDRLRSYGDVVPLVVSDFLTPRAREILTECGAGYGDATGNFRLVMSKPALFIESTGASRDPWPEDQPLKSLKGAAAGRIVRALCDFDPPFAVREFAKRAAVSAASASRVLMLLDREALVERDERGIVSRAGRVELIRRWIRDYSMIKSNRVESFLEPRGISVLISKLRAAKFKYAVTGSLAASWLAPLAPPRTVAIFVENISKVAAAMDLRRADSGSNVMLLEPFDPVVFARTWDRDGVRCAALSQLAADLLTGPGRDPAEGEEILKRIGSASSQELRDPNLLKRS